MHNPSKIKPIPIEEFKQKNNTLSQHSSTNSKEIHKQANQVSENPVQAGTTAIDKSDIKYKKDQRKFWGVSSQCSSSAAQ